LPRRACSITFDDGWRDNYEHGFPILKTAAVPATIFLVSDFIGGRYEFWPNRLARLLAAFSADSSNAMPSQLKDLVSRAGLQRKIDCRAEIGNEEIDRAISVCKALPDVVMNRILDEAEGSMNKTATAGIRSLLDQAEIREMSHSGLVAFGSHTCRHVRLMDCLEEETIRREVRESRVDLEEILGRPVDLFCYPNGDYCDKAVAFVRETYAAAVTVNPGWNSLRSNPHLLRRVSVHEDVTKDALSFAARITGLV
jgi:peptidoglycan/xylan/chitin deacetylase (PgdA/CDA1 family)